MNAVFTHGVHKHRAGDGAAQRRCIEVRLTGSRDVEGTGLNRRDAFGHQLGTAFHQTGLLSTVIHGSARNRFVIIFIGLTEVGCIGIGKRSLFLHPTQRCGRIQTAGESDTDLFANRHFLQNGFRHNSSSQSLNQLLLPLSNPRSCRFSLLEIATPEQAKV